MYPFQIRKIVQNTEEKNDIFKAKSENPYGADMKKWLDAFRKNTNSATEKWLSYLRQLFTNRMIALKCAVYML